MSLILDALRKAESERERETVPGLHTQPVPPLSLEVATPVRPKPWLWIALGVGAGLLVAITWYLAGREPARPERSAAESPAAAVVPAPPPVLPPNAIAPPNAVAPANATVPDPSRDVAAPAPWPQDNRKAVAKAPGKTDQAAVPVLSAAPALYTREQLPDNIRGALPPLAVGGSIYSSTPANRSLILDGKLFRENEQVTSDLLLEEINLKTAVLRIRGYRFEIRY